MSELDAYIDEISGSRTPQQAQFGPYRGKGAQNTAAETARTAGVENPLLLLVDRCEFFAFANSAARAVFMETNRARELIERVDGSRLFRPFVDVDGPETLTEADVEALAEAFKATALAWGAPDNQAAPLAVRGRRAGKTSVHFIADGWQVSDGPTGRAFTEAVREGVNVDLRDYIDAQASGCSSSATFGVRLPWVPKIDGPGGKSIANSILEPEEFWDWGARISPWCLQDDPGAGPVFGPGQQQPQGANNRVSQAANDVEGPTSARTEEMRAALTTFALRISEAFPQFERDETPDPGSLLSLKRTQPSHCPSCDREHNRAGAYVREAAGTLWLNCRRAGENATALLIHRPAVEQAAAKARDEMPDPDEYEGIDSKTADEVATQRFNADAFATHLAEAALDPCDTYLRPPWKTGKTVAAGQLIRGLRARNNHARVLVITCRKTLSTSLAKEFGATDYRKIKGKFDDAAIAKNPVSVWQIESLKRIPSDVSPFDLVVVDEPAALLAHAYQPGANTAARAGVTMTRVLLQKASRIFVADNDLSTGHVEAFKAVRAGLPARVLMNTFRSWEGVPASVVNGGAAPTEIRRRLFEFLDTQAEARRDGRPWTAAVVPCHSRKLADGIAREARERYSAPLVKLYTSETDDAEKERDFADPAAAWAKVAVVIYTATVSVGVSADTGHITDAFAFFTSGNAGAQQSAQMIFRCRRLARISVSYNGRVVHGLPQTSAELFDWATLAKNRCTIPDGFRGDRSPAIGIQTQEEPAALAHVVNGTFEGRGWVCDQLERHRSARWFVPRLVRVLEAAGCAVGVTKVCRGLAKAAEALEPDATAEEHKARVESLQHVREAATEQTDTAQHERSQMAAVECPKALGEFLNAVESDRSLEDEPRQLSAEDHQGQRALFAAKTYADGGGVELTDIEALTVDARTAWLTYHDSPKRLGAYRNLTAIVCDDDDRLGPQETGDVQTATSSQAEASNVARRTFAALGLDESLKTGVEGVIPADSLREPAPELLAVADEINLHALRLFGDTHASRRRKALAKGVTVKNVMGTIGVALAYVGASLGAEYDTARQRHKRTPTRYRLRWDWLEDAQGPAPEPRPTHPLARLTQSPDPATPPLGFAASG